MSSVNTESRIHTRSPLALGDRRPYTVDVAWGTGFELLVGLVAYGDWATGDSGKRASLAAGDAWFASAEERLPAGARDAVRELGGKGCYAELLPLVLETPAPQGGAALVEHLRALSPVRLRRLILGAHSPNHITADVPLGVLFAAAAGDAGAEREMVATADEWHRGYLEALFRLEATAYRDLLVRAAAGWLEGVLQPDERALARTLRASARAARALVRRLEPGDLITQVTNGISYSGEPGIARVVLVPQVAARPWVMFAEHDDAKLIAYGVREEEVTGGAPPEPLVAAYKALGDETRLRILRRLSDGPATLHELTELVGLAKSTVHGHMLVLRTGGLVTADIAEKGKGYALRTDGIAESAALLEGFLTPDAPPTEGTTT
jgi:DNA-binding transcriptional ArsR family regulator